MKRVVQHESKMCGMAGKLEAIRHSLRRYERMVKKEFGEVLEAS